MSKNKIETQDSAKTKNKKPIPRKKILKNVLKFLIDNEEDLHKHYYSVIDKSHLPEQYLVDEDRYELIDESEYNDLLVSVSIVILTANLFEKEILNHNIFVDTKSKIKKLRNGIEIFPKNNFRVVDAYIFEMESYRILHLHAPETGSNTPCGSADLVRYTKNNQYLNPNCIISFGICYGIDPQKQKLGDTLVAKKIYPWSIALKIDETGWNIKSDDYIINLAEDNATLYHHIDQIIMGATNTTRHLSFGKTQLVNMVTGEAVVSNENFKMDSIEKAYGDKIYGGEMEGYGLAKECIYYNNIPCLIIKSICDWGSLKNIDKTLLRKLTGELKTNYKDKIQAYTAFCAYRFLRKLLAEEVIISDTVYSKVNNKVKNYLIRHFYIRKNVLQEIIQMQIQNEKSKFLEVDIQALTETITRNLFKDLIDKCSETDGYKLKNKYR